MHEILFPVLTGLSLVFAGILVGYFLWFRDRNEQLALCQQLTIEKERLSGETRDQASRIAEQEELLERRQANASSMQQLCDDLLASREKTMQHASELESELYSARRRLDQAREQLTVECRMRAKSEESTHVVKQQFMESAAISEREWRDKIDQAVARALQFEADLARLTATHNQTADQLHLANASVAELKSELGAQRHMLEIAKTNAAGLEKEYVSLETSLRSQIGQLNEARGQAAAANSANKLAEESLAECRREIVVLRESVQRLEEDLNTANKFKSRCAAVEQTLDQEKTKYQTLLVERETAVENHSSLEMALKALKKRSENQESTMGALRAQLEIASKRVHEVTKTNEQTRAELEQAAQERMAQLQALQTQLAESESNRLTLELSIKSFSEQNKGLEHAIEQLKLDSESRDVSEELRMRLDSVLRQRDNAFDQITELNEQSAQLKRHMQGSEQTIRNLRRERGAVLLRNRQPADSFPRIHFAPAEETSASRQISLEYGAATRIDPIRGVVFVEQPHIRDDLKKIHGVGDVLERRLNDLGVYTFRQIMQWNELAIEKFSELLIFKDRIRRDDWPAQARRLYNQQPRRGAA